MRRKKIFLLLTTSLILAFCTHLWGAESSIIKNRNLNRYTAKNISAGLQNLPSASMAVYRIALELEKKGEIEKAKDAFLLSASLDSSNPLPLLSLAAVEIKRGDSEFLPHFFSAIYRMFTSFNNEARLIANTYIYLVIFLLGTLTAMLVALMFKYHSFITHRLRENYRSKYSFPSEKYFVLILLVALLVMRLGLALYIALFVVLTLQFARKSEKALLLVLILLVGIMSAISPLTRIPIIAMDPTSSSYKFWNLNRSTNSDKMIEQLNSINDLFVAEREFAHGTLLTRKREYEEATKHLLKAISLKRNFSQAYINLGNIYYMNGNYDRAMVGYMNAIEADSTNAIAYYNLGQTYIKKLLFAQASSTLKKANELGIEELKSRYHSIMGKDPDIFEAGFGEQELWRMAKLEASGKETTWADELFMPVLLIPLRYLWLILVASIIIALFVERSMKEKSNITECDNCDKDTCRSCSNNKLDITLCSDCSKLIEGLSSVKVMEALLRHRRQKVWKRKEASVHWKTMLFPGIAHIYHNDLTSGVIISGISSISIAWIIFGGCYFKSLLSMDNMFNLWNIVIPSIIIALCYLASFRSKPKLEAKNFRVIPPHIRLSKEEEQTEENELRETNVEEKEPVLLF